MRYIVLVDRLPENYEEGFYCRAKESNTIHSLTSKLSPEFFTKKGIQNAVNVAKTAMPILAVPSLLKDKTSLKTINKVNELEDHIINNSSALLFDEGYNDFIRIEADFGSWDLGGLILNENGLNGNYNLEPKSFFSPIFSSIPNFNSEAFKKIMQSGGGSEFIIIEKNKVPKDFHLAGDMGYFSTGIYIQHPKLENKLIPLENSVQHIKDLILAEMVTVLECLGAKKITIQEITDSQGNFSLGLKKIGIGGSKAKTVTKLTTKEFGENGIDLERAKRAIAFTADFPKFRSIIQAREFGNQTRDYFEECVEVSAGVDASVLGLYSTSNSLSLKRQWSMDIEFYDKNQLKLID